MKNLVVDCRMINASGIGTYLKNVLAGIIDSGEYNITCLGGDDLRQFSWFSKVGFIHFDAPILSLAEQLKLAKAIPPCDIYWAPNWNTTVLPVKAKKRLVTVHDVYHLANKKEVPAFKYLMIKLLLNAAIKRADKIVTVSNFSKTEIVKYTGCKPAKIDVAHLAVDDNFDKGFTKTVIPQNYLLYVGNVKPHKNLFNALQAFTRLNLKNTFFYIIGKKEGFITGYKNLDDTISELGDKIFFTGYVSDEALKNYYANARAFVLPSKYEGFGLPLLEALKFNLPVACSNAAALTEVGGNAVEYFNPLDIEDIAAKINTVINPAYSINTALYQQQLAKFSWAATVNKHLKTLSAL